MKKHVLLTSLFAISLSCGAHAATDVTFAGTYKDTDGKTIGLADAAPVVTYEYTIYKGPNETETKSGVSLDETPQEDSFLYITPNDESSSLADLTDKNMPKITDYKGDSAVDGDKVKTTQEIVAGVTAERSNYTYKNADGKYITLGEHAPDVIGTVTLDDGRKITVKNGVAEGFDGTQYGFETSNGEKYTLNESGTGLINTKGEAITPGEDSLGREMQEKFDAAKEAFAADSAKLEEMKNSTGAEYAAGKELFDVANGVFTQDSDEIKRLTTNYNSIDAAKNAFAKANADHAAAVQKQDTETQLWKAATDLFNAPIEETITIGANNAIDASLAEGGAINKAIAAGDEMTLAAAKAYADEQSSLALRSAKNYTDKKVNSLEKELSAGIASAAAMSSIEVSNVSKGEVSVGGGYGYYNSQSAVAFGAAMGLTDNWSVNAAAGLADSNVSFRAGTNYKFKLF